MLTTALICCLALTKITHAFDLGLSNGLALPFLQNIPGLSSLFSNPTIGRGFQTGFNAQPGQQGFGIGGGRDILGLFGTDRGVRGGFDEQGRFKASLGNNWSAMKGLVHGGRNFGGEYDPKTGQLGLSSTSGVGPFFGTNRGINLNLGDLIKKPVV